MQTSQLRAYAVSDQSPGKVDDQEADHRYRLTSGAMFEVGLGHLHWKRPLSQ